MTLKRHVFHRSHKHEHTTTKNPHDNVPLGGGMHSHIKDLKLMANKWTPRPEPCLQTELQTLKPRTDMTKLLIQKEKRVPHFLLSRVVILISSIFQVIIVLE